VRRRFRQRASPKKNKRSEIVQKQKRTLENSPKDKLFIYDARTSKEGSLRGAEWRDTPPPKLNAGHRPALYRRYSKKNGQAIGKRHAPRPQFGKAAIPRIVDEKNTLEHSATGFPEIGPGLVFTALPFKFGRGKATRSVGPDVPGCATPDNPSLALRNCGQNKTGQGPAGPVLAGKLDPRPKAKEAQGRRLELSGKKRSKDLGGPGIPREDAETKTGVLFGKPVMGFFTENGFAT